MRRVVYIICFILFCLESANATYVASQVKLTNDELELYHLLMEYRSEKGLPSISVSPALTYVAQVHARDVYYYYNEIPSGCNPHSWSSHGSWSSCDYYPDHRNAKGMWSKPAELTDYIGRGYEIIHYYVPPTSGNCEPMESLVSWQNSPGHNATMINLGIWASTTWHAVGIGMYKGVACIWFGAEKDIHSYAYSLENNNGMVASTRTDEELYDELVQQDNEAHNTQVTTNNSNGSTNTRVTNNHSTNNGSSRVQNIITQHATQNVPHRTANNQSTDNHTSERTTTTKTTARSRYYAYNGKTAVLLLGVGASAEYVLSDKSWMFDGTAELLTFRLWMLEVAWAECRYNITTHTGYWEPQVRLCIPVAQQCALLLEGGPSVYVLDSNRNFLWGDLYFTASAGVRVNMLKGLSLDCRVGYNGNPFANLALALQIPAKH